MDLNKKYRAFVSISSLNIKTNRRTEHRLRDAVASFFYEQKNRHRNKERDGGVFKWLVKGSTQHLPSSFLETNRSWQWICGWLAGDGYGLR
jgi:hypothetical protein